MILDSPLLNRHDIEAVRQALRELLWHGPDPEVAAPDAAEPEEPQSPALGAQVPDLAAKVRRLVDVDAMTPVDAQIAAVVYGLGGEELLHRHLDLLLGGRRLLWTALLEVSRRVARRKLPYRNETDLVGPIGFRELNFAGEPTACRWTRLSHGGAHGRRHVVRGRTIRSRGQDADLRLAHGGDFRWT